VSSLATVLRSKVSRIWLWRYRRAQARRDQRDRHAREHLERLKEGINDKWRGST
jgi:hypothetical protein